MAKQTFLLLLNFILLACDPGHTVILRNDTKEERKIEVVLADERKLSALDSIDIVDSLKRNTISITKDARRRSYSISLEPGKVAVLQQGIGSPDLTERVIVDNLDTIELGKDKRVNFKKEGVSTTVTIEIK